MGEIILKLIGHLNSSVFVLIRILKEMNIPVAQVDNHSPE